MNAEVLTFPGLKYKAQVALGPRENTRCRLELTAQLVRVISHITPRDPAGVVGVII